ncbi:putative metabolite transport protein CsbC [Pseudovibrio sp. W64]|nr:putative metabolite transport protein CsbC [Pseudovibrio sp. W64]
MLSFPYMIKRYWGLAKNSSIQGCVSSGWLETSAYTFPWSLKGMRMIILLACIAVLCGLLYGYNEGVIAGAYEPIKAEFEFSAYWGGLLVASLSIGGLIGAYLSAYLSDRFGRRSTVIIAALFFITGAVLSSVAQDLFILTFARSLIGMGIGLSSMAGPQYVSEIAPRKIRGRMLGAFQFMISFGVLIGYLSNLITLDLGYSAEAINRWQFMFLLSAIPAAFLLFGIWSAPESPRWLVMAKRSAEAEAVFEKIEPTRSEAWVKGNVKRIEQDLAEVADQKGGWLDLINPRNRPITSFCVFTFLFQQLSGINAVILYAPELFGDLGFSEEASRLSATVGLGAALALAAAASLLLIDRVGRRPLMVYGLPACALSQFLIVGGFLMGDGIGTALSVSGLCLYVISYSLSMGPLPWVYMSEVFPNYLRAKGMVVAVTVNWVFTFLVVFGFPKLNQLFTITEIFLFFAICCCIGTVYAIRRAPETKGVSLEDIYELFHKGDSKTAERPVAGE